MRKRLILMLVIILLVSDSATAKDKLFGVKSQKYEVTAYCSCKKCCGKSDGITATGTKAAAGRTIAVDPKVIPYGSTVLIYHKKELVGIYVAEDCGGAIKNKRIDIFYDNHKSALKWGRKKCKVYVVDAKG